MSPINAAEIMHEATHPPRESVGLTAAQFEIRRTRVGGSEIAAILGLDDFRSSLDIYKEKVHSIRKKPSPEMAWGNHVEAAAFTFLADECGINTRKVGTIIHPEYPWVCATPDGIEIDGEHRVIEIKNVGRWMLNQWGDVSAEEAPMKYRAQVVWTLGCTIANGLSGPSALLVPIFAGEPPNDNTYRIEFPEKTFHVLVKAAKKFMVECVDARIEPDGWEYDAHAVDYVKERWKTHDASMREVTQEALQALRQFRFARERRMKWERVESMAQAKLCNLIGDAEGIEGVATWKANKKGVRTLRTVGE